MAFKENLYNSFRLLNNFGVIRVLEAGETYVLYYDGDYHQPAYDGKQVTQAHPSVL